MRWPLVSRRTYNEEVQLNHDLHQLMHEFNIRLAEAQRHAAQSMALLAARASAPPSPPTLVKESPPLPIPPRDEIAEAIELASGVDRHLARHLAKWAAEQKLDGMTEHDIIQAILHWHTADEWDGDPKSTPSTFGD